MYQLGIIRKFKTAHFSVIVDAVEENDLDLSFDETGEIAAKLDNGYLIAFVARARVFFHGEQIGADYLGNCIYESLADFADHRECGKQNREYAARGEAGRCGSYFADMISEAINEARKNFKAIKAVSLRESD
jgi:hypothetical protein